MNDIADFENQYKAELAGVIADANMPPALMEQFSFESCIRKDKDGKKELYLVTRKADGAPGLLRITKDYPQEDALEEAKLLDTLDHPAIPKVLATFVYQGRNYIVREYIEGRSLYDTIKINGTLPAKDIYSVVLRLCDVLSYLHNLTPPIIHRDIKPQNIIVSPDGGIHLIDFGIARVYKSDQKKDTTIINTELYASPESYGFAQTSTLADIYSLGIVMLFMATGREEKTGLDIQIKDKHLRKLIERCIAFDPKARIQNINAMSNYISRSTRKGKKRRQTFIALGLALLVICLTILSYLLGYKAGVNDGRGEGDQGGYEIGYAGSPDWKLPAVPYDASTGNLSGNIKNTGIACRSENEIFYLSGEDIYRMNLDGGNPYVLAMDTGAKDLAFYHGLLYFASRSGIGTIDPTDRTNQMEYLTNISAESLYITDGAIYFTNASDKLHIYRVGFDGTDTERMNTIESAVYQNIVGGRMYYSEWMDDYKLYSCNLDGSDKRLLYNGECHWLCVYDGMIYFNRSGKDSALVRMELDGSNLEVLLPEPNNFVIATESGIFYVHIAEKKNALEWMSHDGTRRKVIVPDHCGAFNVVGEWIFYENRNEDDALWLVHLDGTDNQRISNRKWGVSETLCIHQ